MSAQKSITIAGGGLAGLTLGIGLRQRDVAVTIWEAGSYPRHRVCGEFISGRGQDTLSRLGLSDAVLRAGAIPAETVAFFSGSSSSRVCSLARPALSISRFVLDELLAREFLRLGGELKDKARYRGPESAEGVVRAGGRRPAATNGGTRWFGMKVHARKVELSADLEMHLSRDSYLGISRLANGEVNICGLFRRRAGVPRTSEPQEEWRLALLGENGSTRHSRMANAEYDEDSFCSIGGLSLRARRAAQSPECCVGDAITMIPPVTGNGMSMAFESAEMAIDPLAAYSRGEIPWHEAQKIIAERCDRAFTRRLTWAGWLQKLMFAPGLQGALVRFGPRWEWVWRMLLEKMR